MSVRRDIPPRIETAVLSDGDMRVSLLSYGAITQGWWYKGLPMILGYESPQDYVTDKSYMGAIVGRVANRIGNARFDMENVRYELESNEGRNSLHSGWAGLSHQNWALEKIAANEAVLRHTSPEGASGFPGEVRFEVRVKLENPRLIYSISAQPDRPTPISIAQHNYYCLGSTTGISGHSLRLASHRVLELDNQGIPSGILNDARKGGMDFSEPKAISATLTDLDNYFVFDPARENGLPVADLTAPNGLQLSVWSDQAGAQVYSGAHLSEPFHKNAGVCIEPSGYPNAVNIPEFPSIIYSPEAPYAQTLIIEISEGET
ncbi:MULTISPECIES: aldose epimerase family protein [unclassified Ruegeria]|uniref:aldose epimerase family protein n=1 Tax=unclassified Ruegeria TaxID=2625375 RepID=UPI001489CF4C|nr:MULTISPECIES: aldose epimerase family protein [unclassified Ruegeria]